MKYQLNQDNPWIWETNPQKQDNFYAQKYDFSVKVGQAHEGRLYWTMMGLNKTTQTILEDRIRPIFQARPDWMEADKITNKRHYLKNRRVYVLLRGTNLGVYVDPTVGLLKTLPCSLRSCPLWELEIKEKTRPGRLYLCSLAGCPCQGVEQCTCIWGKPWVLESL